MDSGSVLPKNFKTKGRFYSTDKDWLKITEYWSGEQIYSGGSWLFENIIFF